VNDIIKGHLKKDATDRQMLVMSRLGLFVVAAIVVAVVVYWRLIGFGFAGMYQAMGIAFSSAVVPLVMAIFWTRTNRNAVFWATIIGSVCGVAYWVHTDMDLLWGVVASNIIVIAVSALIAIPWTLIRPQPFDYGGMLGSGFQMDDQPASAPVAAE